MTSYAAEEVANGIGYCDMSDEQRTLRLGQWQSVNRVRGRSHGGALRERTGHHASCKPSIKPKRFCD